MGLFGKGGKSAKRGEVARPDIDGLAALLPVASTLQGVAGLISTGVASVCVKPAETETPAEPIDMAGIAPYEESTDSFGYAWLTRRTTPTDLSGLIGDVQAISSRIEAAGHGSSLLCAVVVFNDRTEQSLGMIYLFKRGTWYPFAPTGKDTRDNTRELEVKAALGDTLRVDPDLTRWFPVWDAPGL